MGNADSFSYRGGHPCIDSSHVAKTRSDVDHTVLFGSAYAYHAFPDLVRDALALPGGAAFAGGSLWLEKCA